MRRFVGCPEGGLDGARQREPWAGCRWSPGSVCGGLSVRGSAAHARIDDFVASKAPSNSPGHHRHPAPGLASHRGRAPARGAIARPRGTGSSLGSSGGVGRIGGGPGVDEARDGVRRVDARTAGPPETEPERPEDPTRAAHPRDSPTRTISCVDPWPRGGRGECALGGGVGMRILDLRSQERMHA